MQNAKHNRRWMALYACIYMSTGDNRYLMGCAKTQKVKSVRRRHASERVASKLLLCIRYLALNLKVSMPKETVRQQEKKTAAAAKPLNAKISRQLFSPNLLKRLQTREDLFKSCCWAPLSFGNL
jgi:hypothetical protein